MKTGRRMFFDALEKKSPQRLVYMVSSTPPDRVQRTHVLGYSATKGHPRGLRYAARIRSPRVIQVSTIRATGTI